MTAAITPAMVAAGVREYLGAYRDEDAPEEVVAAIYEAMNAKSGAPMLDAGARVLMYFDPKGTSFHDGAAAIYRAMVPA